MEHTQNAGGVWSYPAPLPFRVMLPDGMTRTDPSTFTAKELAAWGFTIAPVRPSFDASTQVLAWDEVACAWRLDDRPAHVEPAPVSVSSAQACLVLDEDGLLNRVEAIVGAMPKAVQIWFARANTWERFNPYVMGICLELDLTEADLDDKFQRAARRL